VISIIIPTYNNIEYLKICINSIKKNSNFNHEVILHINEGEDGTLDYAKKNNIKFTYSKINSGICIGCNQAAKISKHDLLLYAHDDMYFCPNWDEILLNEVQKINSKMFYISGIMINGDPKLKGHIDFLSGENAKNFDEDKLLKNYKKLEHFDFQGSTWAPHLIHKEIWNRVGGFSEEFSPGTGSDPDLNMKLWKIGVRIFKGLAKCKVYHFGSVVTRQKEKKYLTKTETGNKANKIFLLKWGISIKFFKKHYLKSDTKYNKPLDEPSKKLSYFWELIKCKITYLYFYITNKDILK
jgi:glycosyltransferase involved in cell wall biosynthesis